MDHRPLHAGHDINDAAGFLIVDRLGRKQTYMLGITIYGVFSVAGALFYHSIEVLLLVRFMHGVAAGLMIPLSLVLLFDVYGPEVRGRITGAWGCCLCLLLRLGQRWAASSFSMDGLKCCSGSMYRWLYSRLSGAVESFRLIFPPVGNDGIQPVSCC